MIFPHQGKREAHRRYEIEDGGLHGTRPFNSGVSRRALQAHGVERADPDDAVPSKPTMATIDAIVERVMGIDPDFD
jgi:hypothetical protein